MPVSGINPDGTVKIYSSTSGQVLDVKPEDLPKYNPKMVGEYLKLKQANTPDPSKQLADVKAQKELDVIKSGKPEMDPKNKQALTATQNFINNLESHYQAANGGDTNLGPLTRILGIGKNIEGAVGLNKDANLYNREKKGFAATLKALTGDTGVLTDQDFQRLSQLLPDFGSTSKEAPSLFNDLRSSLSAKYGGDPTQTTFKPQEKNILQALIPNIAAVPGKAMDLTNKQISRPSAQGDLGKAVQYAASDVGDLLKTAVPAGIEGGSLLEGGLGLKGVASIPSKLAAKAGGRLTSKAALGAARDEAAKGVEITTKSLIEAGDDYVAKIDPAAAKAWETLKPAIKDTTSAPELLEKLSNWGSKAYTKSGDKRAITEGLLKEHLYSTGRAVIKKQAPEIADLTTKLANRSGLEKVLGKSIYPAALGAGASAGVYGLLSLLQGGKQQ